ncbi:hypothetical protein [Paeniglutamicibacter sp. NPDC091659]|uniref:hypothetical protein n=1 Tax=Paeniglutamicibacter sp. NPDC091659 TaxID=3364389 RepID=UPI003806C001
MRNSKAMLAENQTCPATALVLVLLLAAASANDREGVGASTTSFCALSGTDRFPVCRRMAKVREATVPFAVDPLFLFNRISFREALNSVL